MKRKRRQRAQTAQGTAFVERVHRVRGIFDDRNAVPAREFQNRVHVAGNPGIVHHDDGPGTGRDQSLETGRVDVRVVGCAVCKDKLRVPERKGVRRRHEGE